MEEELAAFVADAKRSFLPPARQDRIGSIGILDAEVTGFLLYPWSRGAVS
jgi:hypothetical protein